MSSKQNSTDKTTKSNDGNDNDHSDDAWSYAPQSEDGGICHTTLGLSEFMSFVDKTIVKGTPSNGFAVGENSTSGSTSTVFWKYQREDGLHLEAKAGFLTTNTGNGGFTLDVERDGSWKLKFTGSDKTIWYDADDKQCSGANHAAPPASNTLQYSPTPKVSKINDGTTIQNVNTVSANDSAGHITFDGLHTATGPVVALDTITGGVGDYMIGGSGPYIQGPAGNSGNCAIYAPSTASVLTDMQNGNGYGGNAEDNSYVNINQVRGSLGSNVLIGNANGTDLKSGGSNSVLISTGGVGYELRPDGTNNTLVSTVGADRVLFDQTVKKTWNPADTTTLLGFNAKHGVLLDLTLTVNNFHAAGSSGNIDDYVKLVETSGGEKLMFSGTGQVATAGVDILDMALVHGYTAQSLYSSHNLAI